MKLFIKPVLFSMAMSTSTLLIAAPSDELKIIGKIVNSACMPNFLNSTVNLGAIGSGALSDDSYNYRPEVNNKFMVQCPFPTKFSIEITDNKSGTVFPVPYPNTTREAHFFGLGEARIGIYKIVPNVILGNENEEINVIASPDFGITWTANGNWLYRDGLLPQSYLRYAFATKNQANLAPVAYKSVVMNFKVLPILKPVSEMDLSTPVALDGSTTFTLHYD